jgi:hypothetical protein
MIKVTERLQNRFLVEPPLVQSSNGTGCTLVLNRAEGVTPVQVRTPLFMFGWGLRGVNRRDV